MLVSASMGHGAAPASSQQELVRSLQARQLLPSQLAADVMASLDRAAFVPAECRDAAYEDRPLPIGAGAVISAPSAHARALDLAAEYVTQRCDDDPECAFHLRMLDVGSGSGYLTAALALLANAAAGSGEAVGLEGSAELVQASRGAARAAALQMASTAAFRGDLVRGEWAQRLLEARSLRYVVGDALAPPPLPTADFILCGGAAEAPPPSLLALLRPGGRLVLPIGAGSAAQTLTLVDRDAGGALSTTALESVVYAPLVPVADALDAEAAGGETAAERLARVQRELQRWQAAFKEAHGRRPSRAEMEEDAEASALLTHFRALGRRR